MRHSFLPAVEQKLLKRRYRIHAAVVALFMLSVAGIIGLAGLFPAYLRVSTDLRVQKEQLISIQQKSDGESDSSLEKKLRSDATLISTLMSLDDHRSSSDLVQEVVSARGVVNITSVFVSNIATTSATLVIQGVAPTRESLVSFKTRLENISIGNKVELPISELAKSKDISFSLRFTRILP